MVLVDVVEGLVDNEDEEDDEEEEDDDSEAALKTTGSCRLKISGTLHLQDY